VNYSWTNNIQAGPIGRSAGWSGGPSLTLDVNIKPISEALWSADTGISQIPLPIDTTKKSLTQTKKEGSFNLLKQFDQVSRIIFKNTIFDFEKLSFNFYTIEYIAKQWSVRHTDLPIFLRVLHFNRRWTKMDQSFCTNLDSCQIQWRTHSKDKRNVPIYHGNSVPGIRAPNANITDAFSQNNQIAMHTSRPLWTAQQYN